MPNQPRDDNPARHFRVDDELWSDAKARAKALGTTISDVLRDALREFVSGDADRRSSQGSAPVTGKGDRGQAG